VPPAGAHPDRWPGRRQPAIHPGPGEGAGPRTGRSSAHPAGGGGRGQDIPRG
jgi:hypothetical protein